MTITPHQDGLPASREQLLESALRLALDSHGKFLASDPPHDAWKYHRVEEVARAALDALPRPVQKCSCKDRQASECPGEWEPGCDLGNNPKYVRIVPAQPASPERKPLTLQDIRALPTVRASEMDGEESDGTPQHWRNRPYVSLTKLERLLAAHGITATQEPRT